MIVKAKQLRERRKKKVENSTDKCRCKANLYFPFPCPEVQFLSVLIISRGAIKLECFLPKNWDRSANNTDRLWISLSLAHTSERGIKDYVFLNSSAEKDTLTANDWAITIYKGNLFDEKRHTLPRCHVRDSQRLTWKFSRGNHQKKKKSRAQKGKNRRNSPKSNALVNRQTDHFEHILQTIPVFYKTKTMAIIESFDFCHLHSLFKPNKCRTEFTKTRRCLTICLHALM